MNYLEIKSILETTNIWELYTSIIITILFTLIGSAIGSFSTVVSSRYKTGRKPWNPNRSYCPTCAKKLSLIQNIPIIGWIIQLGKCWGCKTHIPYSYPIIESTYAITWLLLCLLNTYIYVAVTLAIITSIIYCLIQIKLRKKIWKNYEESKVPKYNNTDNNN